MLLVATDTSGKSGSIALAAAKNSGPVEVIDVVPIAGGTFSAQLIPQLAALLTKHGFRKEDISAFAVASGPGSFTGLRVGLAAIKALAEVLQKPIAAVSLLEVVARAGQARGSVLSALDAGRGEIYAGEYEVAESLDGASATKLHERLLSYAEFRAAAPGWNVVTPDAQIATLARESGAPVEQVSPPTSRQVAQFGWQKLQASETISPRDLDANYIRRAFAETEK
jgi:tRNA threonylcarbamoyladenosine biosynthesis protein TsaB